LLAAVEALIWVALICAPGALLLAGVDGTADVRESEFRNAADAPTWDGPRALPGWLEELQPWFEDALPFRDAFKSSVNRVLLRLGESGDDNVVVGKRGWLFTNRTTDDFLGRSEFPDANLRRVLRTVRARSQWLADHGAHYLFVIAPNKNTIYPEMMPDSYARGTPPSVRQRVVSTFAPFDDVDTLDLTDALRAAKSDGQLYYRQDTHWNLRGALVAVREIHARLAERLPGFTPVDVDAVRLVDAPSDFGTLIRTLALKGEVLEDVPSYAEPWEPDWQPYPVPAELGMPASLEIQVFDNPAGRGTAVFVHDSFGEQVQPWIGKPFARFIDVKRIGSLESRAALLQFLVKREHPELVLEELVERHLFRHLPGNFAAWE